MLDFPVGGVDETRAYVKQRKYPGDDGEAVYTCADALNARGYELSTDRRRGGARPGWGRYFEAFVHAPVGSGNVPLPYSIQDINQIVTGPADRTALYGEFVYARATSGYQIGSPLGANVLTSGVISTFAFQCSCWDAAGNAYVAEFKPETAAVNFFKFSSAAAAEASGFSPDAGSNVSKVVGMLVVGEYLFVAVAYADGSSKLWKFDRSTGAAAGGNWPVTSTSNANLVLPTGGINVLAAVGGLIGVVVCGSANHFLVLDSLDGTQKAASGDLGTEGATIGCKADSDGDYFYAYLALTEKKLCKIATDGTVVWTYTATDANNAIAYEPYSDRVWVVGRNAGGVSLVTADRGVLAASPSLGTTWRDVGADWNGSVVLWADGVASNDVKAVGPLLTAVWTKTLANATHTGSSVQRRARLSRADLGRSRLLIVSGGRLSQATRDGPTVITNGRAWAAAAPVVFSAQNGPYMYYADGTTGYSRYSAASDSVVAWTASAGSMPADSEGHGAQLICTWNGRTVLSGLLYDPQNWFMSAVDDPTDFDYSPANTSETQADAGNNSPAGLVGDRVTTLVPYNDDVLIFGGDHTIWQMTGNPASGGRIDLLSDKMGMAWGRPWTKDPYGNLYFFASRGGVFTMRPASGARVVPERISQQISGRLARVDLAANIVRMEWDDLAQGLFVFVTPYDETADTTHYFWDQRSNAWWPFKFAVPWLNPKCCHAYDSDDPNDRVVLTGSWRSHVLCPEVTDKAEDDHNGFESYVVMGPFLSAGLGGVMLHELQPTLGADSDAVSFEVRVGRTAEQALAAAAVRTGTWKGGRNLTTEVRRAANAVYVKVKSSGVWAMEGIRARVGDLGPVLRRG